MQNRYFVVKYRYKNKEVSINITKTIHSRQKIVGRMIEDLARMVNQDEKCQVVFKYN